MMDAKDQEFLKRLRATFQVEAGEHLRAISAGLIELGKTIEPLSLVEIVEIIFREAHSLKGAARSVNLKDVESICQPLESILAALKAQEIPLSPALFDLLHQAVDTLAQFVSTMESERTADDQARRRELSLRLVEASQAGAPSSELGQAQLDAATTVIGGGPQAVQPAESVPSAEPPEPLPVPHIFPPEAERSPYSAKPFTPRSAVEVALSETVRIPITKLDPLLLQAEELIQAKLAAVQRVAELREIQQALVSLRSEVAKSKDQRTAQPNQMLEWVAVRLDALTSTVTAFSQAFEQDQRALRHMVDDHLQAMKQVLMLPVSTLVAAFPKMVRDLAREQGKEVDLDIRGAEIEIDKRILEELKDPLIHLVRNCLDHGIETPEERIQRQKPEHGSVTLAFSAKDGHRFEILVSDDGAGVDGGQVRKAAVRAGLIGDEAAEKLNPQETLALIFQSGISTSEIITDISGRGLGLAIVREKVEKLGGFVSVDSQTNVGTTFRLLLPMTMATFRGVLVRARQQVFVLPIAHIEHALRVKPDEIQTIENRETIQVDGQIISLVRLGDVLELPIRADRQTRSEDASRQRAVSAPALQKKIRGGGDDGIQVTAATIQTVTTGHIPVLILVSIDKRIAVQVDEVLSEEEVLVKGLGPQLSCVRNITGATVLGNGKVVPVLNVIDLMKTAVRPGKAASALAATDKTFRMGRILVAEDSITSRTLLRNVLETGGYQVATAVDGADAFTQLRSGEFDLVVSDVDMPRMSGFELTTKIRGDKQLGELPVILVTALESRQDRERGIDVGANAYIIKSSFDQSNLLEVIGRLL